MVERIATGQIYTRSQIGIQQSFARLFQSQSILTTGRRVNRASDDPAAARRILSLNSELSSVERYRDNIGSVSRRLNTASSNLLEISDVLTRVRERAIQASNGINDRTDLNAIASEIDSLYRTILSAANGKGDERYLFAGSATSTSPFEEVTSADGITRVLYRGNDDVQRIGIGPGIDTDLNVTGSELLRAGSRGATSFFGSTGAASGQGTDTLTGRDFLQARVTETLYGMPPNPDGSDPATGLRRGAGYLTSDTYLGKGGELTITTDGAGAGTITFDDGSPVSFTGTETSLQVTDETGRVVTVDVTGLAANLAGATVMVEANGTLSLDGGATTTPIDFNESNMVITDSVSGQTVFVNAMAINRAGSDELTASGTFDLFDTLIALRDVLRDPTRTVGEIGDEVRNRIDDLDRASDTLATLIGRVGGRLSQVDLVTDRLGNLENSLVGLRSDVQDADIAATISEITQNQTVYETSLLLASRIRQTSLLNFLG